MKNPIYELKPQEYNILLAEALKKIPEIKPPEWVFYVKSSPSRERVIEDDNFWYKRCASILRQIYKKGTIGVNRLRTRYGGRKNRGFKPERFKKGSGKIIRVIMQQCEAAGLIEKVSVVKELKSKKPGRKLTEKGKLFLESIGKEKLEEKKNE